MKHRFFRGIGPIVSVCLFVLAILLIHHELRGYRYHDILHHLRQVGNYDLLAAVGLTIINYFVLTANEALALRYARHPLPYRQLAFASCIGYAFNNSATIVAGSAARYRIYTALGLSAGEIAQVVIYCGLTVWLGFLLVAGTSFVLFGGSQFSLVSSHFTSGRWPLSTITWQLLGIACLVLVGAYMLGVVLRRRPIALPGWQLRVPSSALSVGQLVVTSTDWLLAAAVLYVLLPSQMHATYPKFIGVFMLGQGLGMISHVPGGLGVFETVLLFALSDGGTAPALTAALLLYRLIYYILPLLLSSLLLAIHEILPRALTSIVGLTSGGVGGIVKK